MAQGTTTTGATASPTPATPPAAPGPHSPRSGSSFFERFGRRPRTANSSHRNTNSGGLPATFSSENLAGGTGNHTPGGSSFRQAHNGTQSILSRSSSSSNINSNLHNFPRDAHASPPATPPAVNQNRNPMATAPPGTSPSQNTGGGPFGRMFRRYSQGAGKGSTNPDGSSSASNVRGTAGATAVSGSGSSSNAQTPGSPSGGRPSALRSLSNHFLPSSSSLANREGLTRTTSNQYGVSSTGLPRTSVESSQAASRPTHPSVSALAGSGPGTTGTSDEAGQTTSSQSGASGGNADPSSGAGRAATTQQEGATTGQQQAAGPSVGSSSTGPSNTSQGYRIRLVPHLEASRSLHFEPIERELRDGAPAIKVGRFTERGANSAAAAAAAAVAAASSASNPAATVASAVGYTREGVTTASGTTSGFGAGQTLGANSRGGDIEMASAPTAAGAAAGGGGSTGSVEAAHSLLALGGGASSSRRQAGERSRAGGNNSSLDSSRIAFKSKVVSRGHAELWCENGGNFYLRDTKSSSGTFLNHIRLSAPGVESRPFRIKDGDVIQLGVDYQGGTEEIYRCVKMRIELNRGWQREANQYNVNAFRQLRALQGSPMPATPSGNDADKAITSVMAGQGATVSAVQQPPTSVTDCCICLFSVTVCQALFIAPCSHVFHYKCIRPLLTLHYPGFSCPLCRTFADLEADVEQDEEWQADLIRQATQGIEQPANTPAPAAGAGGSSATDSSGAAAMSAQPTLAAGAPGSSLPAQSLETVPEASSQHQRSPSRGTDNADSNMAVDGAQGSTSTSAAAQSHHNVPDHDDEHQEILDDEDEEMLEEFDEARRGGREDGGESSNGEEELGSSQASFSNSNNAASLSLSASGSLAARRSATNASAANGAVASSGRPDPARQIVGNVSEPISVPISAAAASHAAASLPGSGPSSGLEDARTPMNQHFLSTLAESSPGGAAFFNAAAALAATSNGRAGGSRMSGLASAVSPNGRHGGSTLSAGMAVDGEGGSEEAEDRSTPEGGSAVGSKRATAAPNNRQPGSGVGESATGNGSNETPLRDEIMSD
ncbi:hypothetical protein OC846_000329 [Tilletia horrida]|uniref:Component of the spindle assembly checkpoint dma1 n=1 Tax=Tilletia horrida TaxID=155126 RepID=A0AAN6H0V2_9BASI|nr:hypothetical protein OC846_000329 [Tilletia horrida]KAK0568282.1 hypothetical protein OC861_002072 [Tilletia horrida]